MPSLTSWILQGTAVTTFATTTAFVVWTKHSKWVPVDPDSDPAYRGAFFRRFNPEWNPTFQDELVRRIPLSKLDRKLHKDAVEGGDKLLTRFIQGLWGGNAYAIQRRVLTITNKNESTAHQLWSKKDLLRDEYAEGTEITDHFKVLSRPDNNTMLLRGGGSPLHHPDGPRESDGLLQITAKADFDQGFAEFRFKCIFFQGAPKVDKPPFRENDMMAWAHRQYTAALLESAVGACKEKLTADIEWDVVTAPPWSKEQAKYRNRGELPLEGEASKSK